jgi:hypothetical protein
MWYMELWVKALSLTSKRGVSTEQPRGRERTSPWGCNRNTQGEQENPSKRGEGAANTLCWLGLEAKGTS